MAIDYAIAERVMELSFGKLDEPHANLNFPEPGTLSYQLNLLLSSPHATPPIIPHAHGTLLASAGVEM